MEENEVTNQKIDEEEYERLKKLNGKLPYFSKSPKNNPKNQSKDHSKVEVDKKEEEER